MRSLWRISTVARMCRRCVLAKNASEANVLRAAGRGAREEVRCVTSEEVVEDVPLSLKVMDRLRRAGAAPVGCTANSANAQESTTRVRGSVRGAQRVARW